VSHPTNPESSVTSLWQPQMLNFVGTSFAHYCLKGQNLRCVIPFIFKTQSYKVLTSIFTFIYLFSVGDHDFTIVNLGNLFLGHTGWPKSQFSLYLLAVTHCTIQMTILSKYLTLWYIISDTPTQWHSKCWMGTADSLLWPLLSSHNFNSSLLCLTTGI
jgi:hypothetical protein